MKKKMNITQGVLLGVAACALLVFPFVAQNSYEVHIINQAGIYILISIGLNLAMGYAGQFNLAVGPLWGVGAYTAAILNTKFGFPFWVNLPAAIILTGLIGAFVGLPSLKVRSHYLAIVTIGLGVAINIALLNGGSLTQGAMGIPHIQMPDFFGYPINSDQRYYYLILVMVILGFFIARQILAGRIGRSFRAIRDDYMAAKAMGVNTAYYQVLAFVVSAAYAGAAGALFAHLNTYISPDIFDFPATLFVLTLTMVGGMGSLVGSLVGGVALPILQEYLRVIQNWQLVAYGVAIMVVVIFMPGGVIELTRRLSGWRKNRLALVDRDASG
ncbi:MAG TPA: branched-chain amino acid ABC transporter permease [Anaerolineales bacterium]|nr:branched-chain amino acid ABC transporter permease [Anaerolineales bacterium]